MNNYIPDRAALLQEAFELIAEMSIRDIERVLDALSEEETPQPQKGHPRFQL